MQDTAAFARATEAGDRCRRPTATIVPCSCRHSARPRSSADRAPASGAGGAGSSPAGPGRQQCRGEVPGRARTSPACRPLSARRAPVEQQLTLPLCRKLELARQRPAGGLVVGRLVRWVARLLGARRPRVGHPDVGGCHVRPGSSRLHRRWELHPRFVSSLDNPYVLHQLPPGQICRVDLSGADLRRTPTWPEHDSPFAISSPR